MLDQGLAPGVQHHAHPQLAPEAFGVVAKGFEGLSGATKQLPIDHLGVQLYPAIEGVGQGKDQMVVGYRQHRVVLVLGPTSGGPALTLWAVAVAAAVIPALFFTTSVTPQQTTPRASVWELSR